ncbi:MAG TPA: cupredoxin domain-containing protein [Chitinophagales bacterium]|nr:cupredoxin domain-containing protein [Chitinophagales bacterium]
MKEFYPFKFRVFLLLFVLVLMYSCAKEKGYTPQSYTVEIKDMKFQPEEISVHKGDTIIWINNDIVAHDVTEENKVWASPHLASGSSWEKVIDKSESYYCSIHLVMKGKIIVEK